MHESGGKGGTQVACLTMVSLIALLPALIAAYPNTHAPLTVPVPALKNVPVFENDGPRWIESQDYMDHDDDGFITKFPLTSIAVHHSWAVSIQWGGYHFCTGTIVSRTALVTSSSCTKPFEKEYEPETYIRIIGFGLSPQGKFNRFEFKVKDHKLGGVGVHGVSVWKIELISGNVQDIPVGIIEMDDGTYSSRPGTILRAVRWDLGTYQMIESRFEIAPMDICKPWYGLADPTDICAIQYGLTREVKRPAIYHPRNNSPYGYSYKNTGAALFTTRQDGKVILVGVTAWGEPLEKNHPGVYEAIAKNRQAIMESMEPSAFAFETNSNVTRI